MTTQLLDAREVLGIERPQNTLVGIAQHLYRWTPAAHHQLWLDALEDLEQGRIESNRLLIVAPPGHAKTNYGSIVFPSYHVGHNPYTHALMFSATSGQSRKSSQTVRDAVASERWRDLFPEVKPDRVRGWASEAWYVQRPLAPGDKDPTMFATGLGGETILGTRGGLLVYDDVSTQKNTSTAVQREKVINWIKETAFSRAVPDAKMLGVMTRWHTDDVAGFFEREGFKVIVMPANGYWENPDKENYRRANINGGPLWPEHVPAEELRGHRRTLGDHKYTGMYQGNPTAVEGAVYREETFGPWYVPHLSGRAQDVLATNRRRLTEPYDAVVNVDGDSIPITYRGVFIDTAMKAGQENDYTVMATWAVGLDRQAYLLDVWRERVEAADLYEKVLLYWRRQRADVAVIEDKVSGTQLIQDLQRKTSIPVSTVTPIQSKEERARAQVHVVAGAFHVPDPDTGPEWVVGFLGEHTDFPRASHDDQVDTTTMAAEFLRYLVVFWDVEGTDPVRGLPDQVPMDGSAVDAGDDGALWTGADESIFDSLGADLQLARPD